MTKDEQTIANLKKLKSVHNGSYGADIDRAIKAVEQDSILDAIKAEIETEKLEDSPNFCVKAHNKAVDRVLHIIDKYKSESGEEE